MQSLKQIADAIERESIHYPETCAEDERASFQFGTFKCSCLANSAAVKAMAAKFRKPAYQGAPRTKPYKPTFSQPRKRSTTALDTFLKDGDVENAEQLASLYGEKLFMRSGDGDGPLPIRKAKRLNDERFAVGFDGRAWGVYRLRSGLAAVSRHTNSKDAVRAFSEIDPDLLERAIEKAPAMEA